KRRKARGRRPLGDHYTVNAYRIAIARACDQAFPHPEIPERLDGETFRDFTRRRKTWWQENTEAVKAWRKAHRWHPHQLGHANLADSLIFGMNSSNGWWKQLAVTGQSPNWDRPRSRERSAWIRSRVVTTKTICVSPMRRSHLDSLRAQG